MSAKVIPMYERRLKVAYKWQATGVISLFRVKRRVPFINLSGRWLQEAGFVIGDSLSIVVEPNRLTIIRMDAEKDTAK